MRAIRILRPDTSNASQKSHATESHFFNIAPKNVARSESIVQRQPAPIAEAKKPKPPKLNYKRAKAQNLSFSKPDSLGWETKLETVANGAHKAWFDLWKAGKYDEFANAVAQFQADHGAKKGEIDGVLGLGTWATIAGYGEAMAGIQSVKWENSKTTCTIASEERIKRGHKLSKEPNLLYPKASRQKPSTSSCSPLRVRWPISTKCIAARVPQVQWCTRAWPLLFLKRISGPAACVPEQQCKCGGTAMPMTSCVRGWWNTKSKALPKGGVLAHQMPTSTGRRLYLSAMTIPITQPKCLFAILTSPNGRPRTVMLFGWRLILIDLHHN